MKKIYVTLTKQKSINNEGQFRYVSFDSYDTKAYGKSYVQGTLVYEDYVIQPITSLHFYNNKIDIIVGADPQTSTNNYIMEDNFLFYDKVEEDLRPYVENIFDVISATPSFRPLKVDVYGDPCVEPGDQITFTTQEGTTISTFVLDKIEKGLQALRDSYDIEGTEYYEYDLNSGNAQIRKLWNNTLVLEQEVETARCYVYAQRNTQAFTITNEEVTIIDIQLASVDATIPVFVATIPFELDLDGEVTFAYYIDGVQYEEDADCTWYNKGEQFATISTFFQMGANERKRFTVTAKADYRESEVRKQEAKIISLKDWIDNQTISVSGNTGTFNYDYVEQEVDDTPPTMTIGQKRIRAEIFASGLASLSSWDGTISIVEAPEDIIIPEITVDNASDNLVISTYVPIHNQLNDIVTDIALNEISVEGVADSVTIISGSEMYSLLTEAEDDLQTEDGISLYTEGDY